MIYIEEFATRSKLMVDIVRAGIIEDSVESFFLEPVMAVFTMEIFRRVMALIPCNFDE